MSSTISTTTASAPCTNSTIAIIPPPTPHIIGKTNPQILEDNKQETLTLKRIRKSNKWNPTHQFGDSSEGQVYLMKSQTTTQMFVKKHVHAIKVSSTNRTRNDRYRRYKYPNEAKILLNKLKPHQNIIRLISEIHEHDNQAFEGRYELWIELCDGGDLFEQVEYWVLNWQKRVPFVFILHVAVEMFQGLAFLHYGLRYDGSGKYTQDEDHTPIIHSDIKIENTFLRWHPSRLIGGMPEVVIGDFGIAKVASDPDPKLGGGTPYSWSPEDRDVYKWTDSSLSDLQRTFIMVEQRKSPADIYAAGMVIHDLLADSDEDKWSAGSDPAELRVACEDERFQTLRELLIACLQIDPGKRATADFEEENGVLPLVHELRVLRDQMAMEKPLVDPREWAMPNPYAPTTNAPSLEAGKESQADPKYVFLREDVQSRKGYEPRADSARS